MSESSEHVGRNAAEHVEVPHPRTEPQAPIAVVAPAATEGEAKRGERFLRLPMAIGLAVYGLFAFTFSYFQVQGDGLVYYNLLRRFFGEEPDFAFAYQFGSTLWNAPFFLVGKALGSVFGFQPRTFHVSFQEISITVATNVAFVLCLYLAWRILRELDLPRGPAVLLLTTFGTPLFYYVVFEPSAKHAVDTLVLTAATYAFLRCLSSNATTTAVVLGALAGWSVNIRFVNAAFFLVLAGALVLSGRRRGALVGVGAAAAVAPLVFAIPVLRGIDYYWPTHFPESAGTRLAASANELVLAAAGGDINNPLNGFDPTIPLKMLFSLHRGLFVWTPLAALAVAGFVLALVRARRAGRHGTFLGALGIAGVALLCTHMVWGQWDGGFAFSQRFLTGLFPLFVIGVAELVRRFGRAAYPALAATVLWAVLIAFVHDIGYDRISERDGIGRTVEAALENPDLLRRDIQEDAKSRWAYVWGLLQGEDTENIHGPPQPDGG